MKRLFNPSIAAILGVGSLILWMVIFNIRPIQDPDLWWHLASGRYMVLHHVIPKTDVFSLTTKGSAWVDTYWLQEIMAYAVVPIAGMAGITFLNSVAIAFLVLFLGFKVPLKHLSLGAKLAGTLWIFLACHPRGYGWGEKASLVTFGFLALLYYTLRSETWPWKSRLAKGWPLLFMLWANMHRGFILGLLILSFFILEKWMRDRRARRSLALWWISCAVATLINPWGFRVYEMGWQDYKFSPTLVRGWAPTPFHHLELFWMTLAIFWCFVGWKMRERQPLGLGFYLTSLTLSGFSMRYASLYPYFVAWAVPWLMPIFSQRTTYFENRKIVPCVFALMLVASLDVKPVFGVNEHIFPVQAVEFLEENNLRVPFFHDYELGGYYLWTLKGQPPDLIDGRYPAVQGYQRLFPEMQQVIQGTPADFHRFLNRYNLHCAILQYPSTRFLPNPFEIYFPRPHWALLYWDDLVLIFVERTPDFQDLIQKYEFLRVQPDANPDYWRTRVWDRADPLEKMRIRKEFLRNLQQHPESWRSRLWLDSTK